MDEQRLAARIRALDAAARPSELVAPSDVLEVAAVFEEWIMRPVPIDVTGLNAPPKVNVQPRQPCGAFERPAWFRGASEEWSTCSGEHVAEPGIAHGWHTGHVRGHAVRFASHHIINGPGPSRCACGEPWPCDRTD